MPGLDDVLGSAGDLASVLAEIAKGRAQGRVQEAGVNQSQAGAMANLYRTQMDAALKGPTQEAQAAAFGDTLANVQPFQFTGDTRMVGNIPVPQSSGGLNPSNYGPATRAAGTSLANQAAGRVTDPAFAMPKVPKLEDLPQSNALDSILNAAGGIGSAAGAAGKNGGDLIGAAKDLINKLRGGNSANPFGGGTTYTGTYDPQFYDPANPDATSGALPGLPGAGDYGMGQSGPPSVDPSLATNYDPVAEFEAWLRAQGQQQGGGEPTMQEDWWTDE